MTRRALLFQIVPAIGVAQTEWVSGETSIALFDTRPGSFMVGLRTSLKADLALIEVFHEEMIDGMKLLLSEESTAPVAGTLGYGASRKDFAIARDRVRFVRVTLLNVAAKRELMPE